MKLKIRGPYSALFEEDLFWSDDAGWVGFDGATIFTETPDTYPMETVGIVNLSISGTIKSFVGIKDL